MTQEAAAGRKTDLSPRAGGIEQRLDEQLALMTEGMRDALSRAAQIPMDYDGHGHNRSSEFQNAIAIARTSSELVLALAKLNGQFNHAISVRHLKPETPAG